MRRVVYTGGTFDLFHAGHVNFLYQCYKIAGKDGHVIVGLNTDEFIEEFKGKPPVYTFEERKQLLNSCKYVYNVIENTGGADSKPAILEADADFIVVGSDWCKKDYYSQMKISQYWLNSLNITLIYVPYTEGISTTLLKQRILQY